MIEVPIEQIKTIPALLGEVDNQNYSVTTRSTVK